MTRILILIAVMLGAATALILPVEQANLSGPADQNSVAIGDWRVTG